MARNDKPKDPKKQKAGRAMVKKYGRGHMKEIAKKGGDRTLELYGHEHFRRIGSLGRAAVIEIWFNGDEEAADWWLSRKGLAVLDRGVTYGQIWFDPGPHPAHQEQLDEVAF